MSIICVMRSMPSVVTFSTCVSPRLNIAEPCARFSTPTSAESGRMSVAERPSRRMPSSITRLRMTFFCSCFHAGPNSRRACRERRRPARMPGAPSPRPSARRASPRARPCRARWPRPGGPWRTRSTASYTSSPKSGLGSHGCSVTPTASTNSCWNSITSAIATLAASRPSATVSSVGAVAPSREQRPGVVGRLALDHQDVDHARLVPAAGDDDVERRLLGLLERGVHDPLAVDQGHADGADRTVERQTGEAGRDGRRVHRDDVVGVLPVHADAR